MRIFSAVLTEVTIKSHVLIVSFFCFVNTHKIKFVNHETVYLNIRQQNIFQNVKIIVLMNPNPVKVP